MNSTTFQKFVWKLLVFTAAGSGAVAMGSRPAEACSPPICTQGYVAPKAGTTVPANVAGFPFVADTPRMDIVYDAGAEPPSRPELRDSNGLHVPATTVPAANGPGQVLVPSAPLAPGKYTLVREVTCPFPMPGTAETEIAVGPAAPLPTKSGAVDVAAASMTKYRVSVGTGECWLEMPASLVKIAFRPSDELKPFMPVARLEVLVDGQPWAVSPWGDTSNKQFDWAVTREPQELVTVCPSNDRQRLATGWGLTEGRHDGVLKVWLPQQKESLPPVAFTFTTNCAEVSRGDGSLGDDTSPDGGHAEVAGTTGTGGNGTGMTGVGGSTGAAGTTGVGGSTATANPGTSSVVPPNPTSKSSNGCSLVGHRPGSAVLVLFLVFLWAMGAQRLRIRMARARAKSSR